VSAMMALGPNVEPEYDPAGLRAAVGFLLASLPLGIFWLVALAAPILLGAFLATVWAAAVAIASALLWWTRRPQRETLVRGLAWISAPLTSLSVRGAQVERRRIARSLGYMVPTPHHRRPQGAALARARVGDPAVWRDLSYLLLLPLVGGAEFAIVVAAFLSFLGGITLPAWLFVAFPDGVPLWQDVRIDTLIEASIVALVALPVPVLVAYLSVVGLSQAHAALAGTLLGPSRRARLAERVEELTESRSRAVRAALAERRRIERDLHDGAQQRLVSLAMELGMAKEKMPEDPEAARKLLEAAHGEAKRALAEIRDLVRGIHPAVLSDRGLDAAISALAGRCPVPVVVNVDLDGRPSEAVETTAYFVVAEALANVAKHAGASEAQVAVRRERNPQERLVVEVVDDGKGGADPGAGTGLAGLRDRLSPLDGRLSVDSPAGGPTRVRAQLPLGAPDAAPPEAR
jgi:signal transduction histidine kinase